MKHITYTAGLGSQAVIVIGAIILLGLAYYLFVIEADNDADTPAPQNESAFETNAETLPAMDETTTAPTDQASAPEAALDGSVQGESTAKTATEDSINGTDLPYTGLRAEDL